MAELKDAPKPKTANGQGQVKNIAHGTETAPITSHGSPFAFMRRFAEEMDHLFEDFGVETRWHLPRFRSATNSPFGLTSFDIDSRWHLPKFLGRGRELLHREAGLVPAEWSPKSRRPGARGTVRDPRRSPWVEQGRRQGGDR